MRTLARAGIVATLLALAGTGCDYGLDADGMPDHLDRMSSAVVCEPAAGPTQPTEPSSTTGAPSPAGVVPVTAAFTLPTSRSASGDCIDFSTGSARLVPCTVFRTGINPVGHDDPDPWRPAPTPSTPF